MILSDSKYMRFWIIAYPPSGRGVQAHYPAYSTGQETRSRCITKWVKEQRELWNPDRPEASYTWRQWYARGYCCVRVKVVRA